MLQAALRILRLVRHSGGRKSYIYVIISHYLRMIVESVERLCVPSPTPIFIVFEPHTPERTPCTATADSALRLNISTPPQAYQPLLTLEKYLSMTSS